MIPVLYPRDIDISTLSVNTSIGLGGLVDCVSATVIEERNGEFELEIKYPQNGIRFDEITIGSYIKAKPAVGGVDQFFRVYRVTKPIDGICTICAEHVSYLLNGYICKPFEVTGSIKPINAIDGMTENVIGKYALPFTFTSLKQNTVSKYKIDHPEALRALLGGVEGSVLDVFNGGEYEFDNNIVIFHEARGADNGVTVAYGKNLTDLKHDISDENIITGVYPYWHKESEETNQTTGETEKIDLYYDRTTGAVGASAVIYNQTAESNLSNATRVIALDLSQEEKYSENPPSNPVAGYNYRGAYSNSAVYNNGDLVDYKCNFYTTQWDNLSGKSPDDEGYWIHVPDDYSAEAEKYFNTHKVVSPDVNLDISFIDLAGTEEYKNVMPLEQIHLCDIVHVEYPEFGISVALKVIRTEFDVIGERYNKISLGNTKTDLARQFQAAESFEDEMKRTVPTRYNVNDGLNHLMELIGMVGGGYRTVDSQGGWTYYHDQPLLANSVRVIRVGAAGIFFSESGVNGTFTSGWGIDGQAVFEMATAWRLNAERLDVGFISADGTKNGNYWDLDSGEFCLKAMTSDSVAATKTYADDAASGAETRAKSYADGAITSYDTYLNQQEVFDKLTNGLQDQGIFLYGGQLYINASMIGAGAIEATWVKAYDLTVNGVNMSGADITASITKYTSKLSLSVIRFPYMVYVQAFINNDPIYGDEPIAPDTLLASGFPAFYTAGFMFIYMVGVKHYPNDTENNCTRILKLAGGVSADVSQPADLRLWAGSSQIAQNKQYFFSGWYRTA